MDEAKGRLDIVPKENYIYILDFILKRSEIHRKFVWKDLNGRSHVVDLGVGIQGRVAWTLSW